MVTKQEFATLVVAMQAMYGEDFIGTEEALDVWYALLHDLDYHILSKALQQYMLTNKFKPTVAELRDIYTELVSPSISDWSEGWEKVSRAIGHYGMYQEQAAMESFDEVTREVVKRLAACQVTCRKISLLTEQDLQKSTKPSKGGKEQK